MNTDTAKRTNCEVCETKYLDRVFLYFCSTVYVFALFYQHYFMIEKIKKFLPQSAGKCISEGQILKILLGDMPLAGLSKVAGCRRKLPPTWLVSDSYSA